jgi:membrane dipeptidase
MSAKRQAIRRADLDHVTQAHAHAVAVGQFTYYQMMERQGHLKTLRTAQELESHWAAPSKLGIILSMEGADPITSPDELPYWHSLGLRAIGPAHYGQSHYAYGTGVSGPLSARGIELLRAMDDLHMILDVTHLCDQSMAQALDYFDGPVLASHHNCRALVPGDRQLADDQIKQLIARDAVIGVALDAWMLHPNWVRGQTKPEVVSLEALADHIDHINQLAGNSLHCAIGSDLDGGFGTEQTPRDLDTIADLQKLIPILKSRGYADADLADVFHGNWLRFFAKNLPAGKVG